MSDSRQSAYKLRTLSSLGDIDAETWDVLANPDPATINPFVSHAFLSALETSRSAIPETGWYPQHVVLENGSDKVIGLAPCYVKTHSQGEYVFDYGWADAYERAGGRYYPKLQCSVPFTPVTGPRLLAGNGEDRDKRVGLLARALSQLCDTLSASSVHTTFLPHHDWSNLHAQGWLQRTDTQFHWYNDNYPDFSAYLDSLSSRKRKNIRKERNTAIAEGIEIECLTGPDLKEHHWDAFFDFYLDTGSRKWGSPYLTRAFFSLVNETMPANILLVMAKRAGRYIAGALNFIGGEALYGRNWGAIEHHDCLHFELCYYQAIEFAIAHRLPRVEAGAQGAHKLARGYLPATTYSLHYLADPALSRAVADYLEHEQRAVKHDQAVLAAHSPFRRDGREEDSF